MSAAAGDQGAVWLYTVRRGDTLITVAARYLAQVERWPEVQRTNQITDPTRLIPGTILRIPAAMLRRQPAEVTVEASSGQVRWR
ncbi:MAG TPA: LysM domain-containing protein, partial [Accumulibacter sp.]|nr:LysM domain-containing protein [Accumulibacter sp.]